MKKDPHTIIILALVMFYSLLIMTIMLTGNVEEELSLEEPYLLEAYSLAGEVHIDYVNGEKYYSFGNYSNITEEELVGKEKVSP